MSAKNRTWFLAALVLGSAWMAIGCNPASINFLLMPFVDDKVPAKCKLAHGDKEVHVAILCTHSRLETRPELLPADSELSERLAMQLRKRCAENKEKIKIIPPSQARSLVNQNAGHALSLQEIGEKLKADIVVNLEINSISLYEKGSHSTLFRGNTEITVTVADTSKPKGENTVFQEVYRREYPGSRGPIDASGSSVLEFRTLFLNRIAGDLARMFTAFPPDERFLMD
jgi:hypothetical protein